MQHFDKPPPPRFTACGSLWQRLEPRALAYEREARSTESNPFAVVRAALTKGDDVEGPDVGKRADVSGLLSVFSRRFSARVGVPMHFGIPRGKEPFVQSWQARLILQPLLCTPVSLFRSGGLTKVMLYEGSVVSGGVTGAVTGAGSAIDEGSAYGQKVVRLFPAIFEAGARTLVSVATHEFGHALFQYHLELPAQKSVLALLRKSWVILKANEGRALYGIDLERIGNAHARRVYQAGALREFLAEIYMLYLLHDTDLWAHIQRQSLHLKDTWMTIWNTLKEILGPPVSELDSSPDAHRKVRQ